MISATYFIEAVGFNKIKIGAVWLIAGLISLAFWALIALAIMAVYGLLDSWLEPVFRGMGIL